MSIEKQKRERYIRNLIKEAILNVLVEQQPAPVASQIPPPASQPNAQMNPNDPNVQNPPEPPPAQEQEQEFNVDEMVNKLNVLRGSKSFKDPEVFGRLTSFFKNLTDEQKSSLDYMLSELGKIVIDATEGQAGLNQPQAQPGQQKPAGGPQQINQAPVSSRGQTPPGMGGGAAPIQPAG